MKIATSLVALASIALAISLDQAQTPGSILGLAGQVNGTVTVTATSPGGCATRVCTTNYVTAWRCYTNVYWKRVCTTNSTGQVQCTNVPVPITRCYTNTYPKITCTNEYLNPAIVRVQETLAGALAETVACNELAALFPSNAVFQAGLSLNLRTNDWAGTHAGYFKVLDGTNVLASGSLSGVNGVSSRRSFEPCSLCNHFEGALNGTIWASGPLRGARLRADYAASLTDVACPSPGVPQGAVVMVIDGVAVTPCFSTSRLVQPIAGF